MFQLRMEEIPDSSKSQIVTLNERGNKRGSNIKKFRFKLTKEKFENLRFQTGTSSESYTDERCRIRVDEKTCEDTIT